MDQFSFHGAHENILRDAYDLVLREYGHDHDYVSENDASILINYVNISLFYYWKSNQWYFFKNIVNHFF